MLIWFPISNNRHPSHTFSIYTSGNISRNKSWDNFATKTWYFCWSSRIMGFKAVLVNPLIRCDQVIVVGCCNWSSFWYLGKPKLDIWRLYYVTSFFSKIPRRKEVVEFEEFTFFLKALPNIPPNLKCNVLYVNMLLGSLVDEILNVNIFYVKSLFTRYCCVHIFFRSGYLSSSLYLCLGHCSGLIEFDQRILNIRKSLHRLSWS